MSESPSQKSDEQFAELRAILESLHHNTVTREQVERLDLMVRTEAAAADFVARYMSLLGDLHWLSATVAPPSTKPHPIYAAITAGLHELGGLITRPIMWIVISAAIVTASLLTANWRGFNPPQAVDPNESVAMSSKPAPNPNGAQQSLDSSSFVATITQLADCQWPADVSAPPRLRARLAVGSSLRINSGLAEVTFDNGARVTLQGPAHFEIDAPKAVRLHLGRAFASIPATAKGFQIETRGATWIDQGTEFGVAVEPNGESLLQVNQGRVDVELGAAYAFKTLEVTTGQAVRYNPLEFLAKAVDFDAKRFVTQVPVSELRVLDLVDIVAGGDGRSARRGRGINPSTGRVELAAPQQYHRRGDGAYHRVPELPFVDGVFIADGDAGSVQLDSRGHTYAKFPHTDNRGYGYIWAGGQVPGGPNPGEFLNTRLGEVDYAAPARGILSLHANHAITFDLAAIRTAFPQAIPTRFKAVGGNTGKVVRGLRLSADFWVFVDGELRAAHRDINKLDGAFAIDVPLDANAQCLTLVATDGGKSIDDDWIMFGEPRLEMAPVHEPATRSRPIKEQKSGSHP